MKIPSTLLCGLLVTLIAGCQSSLKIPNASMTGEPGTLQRVWQASGAFEPDNSGICPNDEERVQHGITEIGIEQTHCFGFCRTYTLILRSAGTAEYTGQANVERVGTHTGRIDQDIFNSLALLAIDIGFFDEFEEFYGCLVTDSPTVYVSIVRGGERKTIKHYAPGMNGPPRLQWLEFMIDLAYGEVEWN